MYWNPVEKADKQKLEFFSRVNARRFLTSLFATPIATPNGRTMAEGSLPRLQ
jgi:hypothetical protein